MKPKLPSALELLLPEDVVRHIYKFVPHHDGTPDCFFAWVSEESIVRELVALFIAREFMLGMEN